MVSAAVVHSARRLLREEASKRGGLLREATNDGSVPQGNAAVICQLEWDRELVLRGAGGLERDFLAVGVDQLAVLEAVALAQALDVFLADDAVRASDEH